MKAIEVSVDLATRAYAAGLIRPVEDGWEATDLGIRVLREYLEGLEAA